jgi:hypothetical protein
MTPQSKNALLTQVIKNSSNIELEKIIERIQASFKDVCA